MVTWVKFDKVATNNKYLIQSFCFFSISHYDPTLKFHDSFMAYSSFSLP